MIDSKKTLREYLKKDKYALGIERKHPKFFGDDIWKFEIILRKHEYYENCSKNILMKVLYKYLHYKMGLRLGFQIPCNVFEAGLCINHFGLIIVNDKARIGQWCDIHQGVSIGQNTDEDAVPVIGENVWIGPGAKIFGKIVIGDNTMIGANSVVTKSFEQGNVRIAGNPAKVISEEGNAFYRG